MHRHDEWLVGVTDWGVQDFFCRGARRHSTAGRVILIEPGEMHDGQAGAGQGFAYRMLYLPQAWVRAGLDEPAGEAGFGTILIDDERLGAAIRDACMTLGQPMSLLHREAALDAVLDRLRPHFGQSLRTPPALAGTHVARRARACLHEDLSRDLGADALARAAGAADRFQLARTFRHAFGVAPHGYRLQIRLTEARRLLSTGIAPAEVAAACGFADQSHLGRWFRRAYGLTPAAYRRCCTGVPDGSASAA